MLYLSSFREVLSEGRNNYLQGRDGSVSLVFSFVCWVVLVCYYVLVCVLCCLHLLLHYPYCSNLTSPKYTVRFPAFIIFTLTSCCLMKVLILTLSIKIIMTGCCWQQLDRVMLTLLGFYLNVVQSQILKDSHSHIKKHYWLQSIKVMKRFPCCCLTKVLIQTLTTIFLSQFYL